MLALCADLRLRPGDALPLKALWHRGIDILTGNELADGVESGVRMGWFETSEGDRYLLTEAGFAAM